MLGHSWPFLVMVSHTRDLGMNSHSFFLGLNSMLGAILKPHGQKSEISWSPSSLVVTLISDLYLMVRFFGISLPFLSSWVKDGPLDYRVVGNRRAGGQLTPTPHFCWIFKKIASTWRFFFKIPLFCPFSLDLTPRLVGKYQHPWIMISPNAQEKLNRPLVLVNII